MASPLIVQPRCRSAGSSSSGKHDLRPYRAEAGHGLAEQPLVAVQPLVARGDVVDDGVAQHAAAVTHHDAQLALAVDVRREAAIPDDGRPMGGQRRRRLAVYQGALRPADLRCRRVAIVETDGIDGTDFDGGQPVATDGHAHRSGVGGRVGEQRRGRFAHDVGHPANTSPPLERDRRLSDEHLFTVSGAQAASTRRRQQWRLGRHVDEVEHGRMGRQLATGMVMPASTMPTVVAFTARSADRTAAMKSAPSSGSTCSPTTSPAASGWPRSAAAHLPA